VIVALPATTSGIDAAARPPDRAFRPLSLRFRDPALERRYHADRLPFRRTATAISSLAGALTWLVFLLLDAATLSDPSPGLFATRLAGIAMTAILFAVVALRRPGRWIEAAGAATVAANTGLLVLCVALMSPDTLTYCPPSAIFTMAAVTSFALCAVTFVEGAVLSLLALTAFLVATLVLRPEPPLLVLFQGAWLASVIGFSGVGSYFLDRTQRIAWLREAELARAEDRARALLHNVLPPSIALRKLSGEHPIADDFPSATLLFADIVNFTGLSARLEPTAVVGLLGDLFRRFDGIVARHGLEKIKTIGDCYMVAGGIPHPDAGHLDGVMRAACEMMEAAAGTRDPDGTPLRLRIGIHSGPVTAGVIGEARFIFDVWGDTVNLASRMESHGVAGRIQVTEAVAAALEGRYRFEGPHLVEVKGRGPMPVWRLTA